MLRLLQKNFRVAECIPHSWCACRKNASATRFAVLEDRPEFGVQYAGIRDRRNGNFWQPEPFDHLARSAEQYDSLRDYIAQNPEKALLQPREYCYRNLKSDDCRLSLRERTQPPNTFRFDNNFDQASFRGAKGDNLGAQSYWGVANDPKAETQIFERCRPHWSQVFVVMPNHVHLPAVFRNPSSATP